MAKPLPELGLRPVIKMPRRALVEAAAVGAAVTVSVAHYIIRDSFLHPTVQLWGASAFWAELPKFVGLGLLVYAPSLLFRGMARWIVLAAWGLLLIGGDLVWIARSQGKSLSFPRHALLQWSTSCFYLIWSAYTVLAFCKGIGILQQNRRPVPTCDARSR